MKNNRILFIRICFYIGAAADLAANLPLLFPEIAGKLFGISGFSAGNNYLYVSRIGASLMAGWTLLLIWGSLMPVERKGILLLTVFPVLSGLIISSILAVASGLIEIKFMAPLWIFYAIILPLFIIAYLSAYRINKGK
jgi:hypothetical protein